MTKSQIVEAYRLPKESRKRAIERVAALLRIHPSAVYQWPERMAGPRMHAIQCQVQLLSQGRLVADPLDLISNEEARAIRDDSDTIGSGLMGADETGETLGASAA